MTENGIGAVGVLLAGGLSQRMGGGDKSLLEIGGRPILAQVIERARPQVDALMLNINGDHARFEGYDLPIASDVIDGHAGPLAGVLTGVEWAAENYPETEWLVSFATDAPFFPTDLVRRLLEAAEREGAEMACAVSDGRTHPVFALWPVALRDELRRAMVEDEIRRIDRWTARYRISEVTFETDGFDPFFNINRPENLEEARALIASA